MKRMFERGMQGAGGMMGATIGAILAGATLAIPGVNLVAAPIVAAAVATTASASGAAWGTAIGGTVGAISGAVEDAQEK